MKNHLLSVNKVLVNTVSCERNKAKRFANRLLFDVINALACVYCYFLQTELNGYHHQNNKKLHWSFVNCFSLRKAIKIA